MNWQAKDKLGATVDLQFRENVDRENRGFEIDEVTATINGNLVGYLKVSNVPARNFKLYLPTIWHYLGSIGGWYTPELFEAHDGKAKPISCVEFLDLKVKAAQYYYGLDCKNCSSYEELMKKAETCRRHRENISQYKKFQAFYKDKPYVDYVNVGYHPSRQMEIEHRGRGIGMMLYSAAAHSLKQKKLLLHASGLQSNDAQRMWKHFEDAGWTETDVARNRRYLRVDKMPEPNKILQKEYA